MWIMPATLSGSTVWDVGCGDDCEDPSGVFSGQEADQADLPGVADIPEHGAQEAQPSMSMRRMRLNPSQAAIVILKLSALVPASTAIASVSAVEEQGSRSNQALAHFYVSPSRRETL